MAATFEWSESNGAGEVISDDISHLNFGSVDESEINVDDHPIVRGTYSFIKYLRGKFSGVFTEISHMKFWKFSGEYVTGELIKAEANVSYATPVNTDSGDSTIPITEGTALDVESAEGEEIIENGATGVSGYTGYIRLQEQTTSESTLGHVNQKTFVLGYDEC